MDKIILYCRQGFEKECALEITEKAATQSVFGYAKVKEQCGYVVFQCYQHQDADKLARHLLFSGLIFARQMLVVGELLKNLPVDDRISPIVAMLKGRVKNAGILRVEVADTNEGKIMMKFCRKFTVPLRMALRKRGILLEHEDTEALAIHVFFIAPGCCYVGYSYSHNHSPFLMGIPRLKFPLEAPSRSTLKLEEAFHLFIPYDEWDERLAGGMQAVDLGASPGGWTYQLVKRSMMVKAVDKGSMAPGLMATGQVTHYQEDGFKFVPTGRHIDWLVCDMVEKPTKVVQLMTHWLLEGWCREVIFNLKLPMKKRYEQVNQNLASLLQKMKSQGVNVQLQAKQLYHDREEITVHARRIWGVLPGRRDK